MAVALADGLDPRALLRLLADGEVHPGGELANALGGSRAAVAKAVDRLRSQGIEVDALARRGYRLPRAVELLDAERIRAGVGPAGLKLDRLEVLLDVDSTNTRLLAQPAPAPGHANAALSELQHAGRGRRGRQWVSPFGASIALSMGCAFGDMRRAEPALSLAVGVAVARALRRAGAKRIRLKWPNDVWFDDQKIGGVLVETTSVAGGAAHVVIGVGLNLSLSNEMRREIEAGGARVAALSDACEQTMSRNALAAALLTELLSMLPVFEQHGFAPFREEWGALDALGGRPSRVLVGVNAVEGVARGVDADGALLLDSGGRLQRFVSGEVSLRLAALD